MRGYIILFVSAIYGTIETAHYGYNFSAQTDGEMIADGITLLLMAIGMLTIAIEKKK